MALGDIGLRHDRQLRPSIMHESAENVCSLGCESARSQNKSCRLKALSGHKLPIYMWFGAPAP